jgi:hypothetical protein
MPQKTQSSRKRSTSRSTKGSTSRNGSAKANASSRTRRTSSNGRRATASRRATTSRANARRTSANGPVGKTGKKISNVASKAKTPLVAGGAALAGIAGGVALKTRAGSKNSMRRPIKRLRSTQLPKVDLDAITSAAHKMQSIGEQVGDVADAADRTRKKH